MPSVDVQPFEIEFTDRLGQKLKADVYLPENQQGPFPVLFAASPYQKALRHLPAHWMFPFSEYGPMQFYLDNGYAYVILDLPGSGVSEGTWDPWSIAEGEAAYDAIEFIATQDWSTGKTGMIGQSYFGMSQWNTARTRPPHLTTIVPYDGATDHYRDWAYQGGIPTQGFLGSWLIGSVMFQHFAKGHDPRGGGRSEFIADFISHPKDDDWWRGRSPFWDLDKIEIPTFSIGIWGKMSLHLRGNVNGYLGVKGPRQLLIAEPDSFSGAQKLFDQIDFHRNELLPWYEHHLKGVENGVMDRPKVRYFTKNTGETRTSDVWPPASVQPEKVYLSGTKSDLTQSLNDGSLSVAPPTEEADSTSWSYPDDLWMAGVTTFKNGVPDHVARVVTYTSVPATDIREYTGHGALVLQASTDQTDLEIFAKLSLLTESNGRWVAQKVSQGWLRGSRRREDPEMTEELRPFHAHTEDEPLTPGEIAEMRVELFPMSFEVRPGDRLRLELTNADSAMLDQPMIHWYGQKVGTDTYWHDSAHLSHLLLPRVT